MICEPWRGKGSGQGGVWCGIERMDEKKKQMASREGEWYKGSTGAVTDVCKQLVVCASLGEETVIIITVAWTGKSPGRASRLLSAGDCEGMQWV